MLILGIDPGTATTGYGLIKKNGKNSLEHISHGCIFTDSGSLPGDRLKKINKELEEILRKHKPGIVAVETLYFFKNLKTVMPVSQAKGVIMFTVAKRNIPMVEFTPMQVKMAVAGYGKAEKKQIQKMLTHIFPNLKEIPKPDDAADALALAYCCAREMDFPKPKG